MRHFQFIGPSFYHFVYFVHFVMTLFVVRRGLDFVILMILPIQKHVSKSRKVHHKVFFVVNLHASDLDTQKWQIFFAILQQIMLIT